MFDVFCSGGYINIVAAKKLIYFLTLDPGNSSMTKYSNDLIIASMMFSEIIFMLKYGEELN